MPPIAKLDSVSKVYGNFAALRQVTVEFERGACYVLLGENGAGKSTLLRMLAGLLRPTHGSIRIFGDGPSASVGVPPEKVRDRIGYMAHAPMMYDELTALENLLYFANLFDPGACLDPVDALLSVGLEPRLERKFGEYSQGMKQRASLARVLLSSPRLLLLDEPFSNMDVASAQQMIALLARQRQAGRSILLTTHQRDLAAPLADHFLTLEAGRIASLEPGPAAPLGPDPVSAEVAEARP